MPLRMNREVFITCAVTGAGATQDKSPHVPRSPAQIADSAIAAARAGAAVVHCHARNPETGAPARDVALYREITRRIRDADIDVVLNLTCGLGGDLTLGPPEAPLPLDAAGTDLVGVTERLAHIAACRPEICTLDCGSMNFGEGDYVMTNTTAQLRAMAQGMEALGVRPELELFDTGHLWFATRMAEEGLLSAPVLAGGNVRVGLEDNLYLERGVLATNAQLVERAVGIVEGMGARVLGPAEVRERLKLRKQAMA